jgi:two-component system cell cycle sensor histidine kinase/response regulator CckA
MESYMSDLNFSQLVDIEQIRLLLESQYKITGTSSAILDSEGNILLDIGWQDICTRFHRVHPDTRSRCIDSDLNIKAHLYDLREGFIDYRCGNGLRDVAVPIIINGEHLATFFIGQFFYDDDMPDPDFFLGQADQCDFDRKEYLAALARVPIYNREHIRNIMDYYRNLVELLADLGLKNLSLTQGIAGRKKTEEALHSSEMMLHKVFESIPDLMLVINKKFHILKSNWHGGYDYIDKTVRDKSPHCYETFYPGRPSPCKSCPAKEVFATGKPVTVEKFSPKTKRKLEIRAFPIFDETGKVSMVAEHVRDVTEQRKAQQSLIDSEKKFRSLFEAMQEGFALYEVVYDETGKPVDYRFLDVNPAFESSAGYHRSLVTGKTIRELMPEIEQSWIDEFQVITYSPQPGQLAAIFVDLTERRRLQEELVKGQKLESLGILAGGIAHDFNNILAGILGNLSVARMVLPDDHRAQEHICRCEKAVQQATGLTQQLLTFSRGGSPVKKVVNLRQIIEESALFALHGSNVTSTLQIAGDLWLVEADEGQITQVINNLLINADQAMPGGGVVRIEAGNRQLEKDEIPSLESGRYVHIKVIDHGKGIPPKHLDKIFDPYFTTKETGTGLGLTSLYSIVRKHDGQVLVSSQMGKGTAFEIYLPACPECVESGKSELQSSVSVGNGYIFVMDDEMMIREVAEEMIAMLGYRVETFSSGEQVVERYKAALESATPPDAVIMDLTIPGQMGGLEAASLISAMDPNAVLIVSSGYSNDPVMANYRAYGFSDILLKPFSVDSLGSSLKKLLERKRQVE